MAELLQGRFLVAANHMKDPNFYRSVVLMLEDNDDGAMGLVINRPSSIGIDAALAKGDKLPVNADPIYSGGPVETTALFILHSCVELSEKDEAVCDGIFLTGSNDSFESLLHAERKCDHDCGFRVYCGYAGWGVGQLNSEIDRGDWRVMMADPSIVFRHDPYEVWEACNQTLCEQNRILRHNVRNPEWN
ncbi:MAG: YqgE/AlgH family protein [Fuerstiella sp.]